MSDICGKELDCYGKQNYAEKLTQHVYQTGAQNLLDTVYRLEYDEYENHVQRKGYHDVYGCVFGLK